MTRAGEKLYGDWQRAVTGDRRLGRIILRRAVAIPIALTIAGAIAKGLVQ